MRTVAPRRDLIGYTLDADDTAEVLDVARPAVLVGSRPYAERLSTAWWLVWHARFDDVLPRHDHTRRGVACRRCRVESDARDAFLYRVLG